MSAPLALDGEVAADVVDDERAGAVGKRHAAAHAAHVDAARAVADAYVAGHVLDRHRAGAVVHGEIAVHVADRQLAAAVFDVELPGVFDRHLARAADHVHLPVDRQPPLEVEPPLAPPRPRDVRHVGLDADLVAVARGPDLNVVEVTAVRRAGRAGGADLVRAGAADHLQ